jgi:hypothetical protein
MTYEQRQEVHSVHLLAQQYALENGSRWAEFVENAPGVSPRRLVITVRHHDWWSWENDAGLYMDNSRYGAYGRKWQRGFLSFPALEEFEMELETLERRRKEMDELVKCVQTWRIPLGDGKVLSTEGMKVESETWMGTTLGAGPEKLSEEMKSISYYVARIKWRVVKAMEGEDVDRSECSVSLH